MRSPTDTIWLQSKLDILAFWLILDGGRGCCLMFQWILSILHQQNYDVLCLMSIKASTMTNYTSQEMACSEFIDLILKVVFENMGCNCYAIFRSY